MISRVVLVGCIEAGVADQDVANSRTSMQITLETLIPRHMHISFHQGTYRQLFTRPLLFILQYVRYHTARTRVRID